MKERKLFSRQELPLLLGLLALCALLFLLTGLSDRGSLAVVERDGEVLLRRELSALSGPEEMRVTGRDGIAVTVTLYPDGAAVTDAGCPDRICVRTGKLTRAGETAVCLPAGVSLRLEGAGADAETY